MGETAYRRVFGQNDCEIAIIAAPRAFLVTRRLYLLGNLGGSSPAGIGSNLRKPKMDGLINLMQTHGTEDWPSRWKAAFGEL